MAKMYFRLFVLIVCFLCTYAAIQAQEFSVAAGSDTTFSGGAVYGGRNGLVALCGDSSSQYAITAQLIGTPGNLIGSRIHLGATGITPGAVPIFDGTNYFLVWRNFDNDLKGQFIDTSGILSGPAFTIASDVQLDMKFIHCLGLGDSTFLTAFIKSDGFLYGQRVSKTGGLLGGALQISSIPARDFSIAFDGTNFLLVWVEVIPDTDKDIYGQFVSEAGTLIGSNFLIDGGSNYSDNPTSLAFDGTRYLLAYHETPALGASWTIAGRFITTSGTLEEAITICDSTNRPTNPSVAFDNSNYLVTWFQYSNRSLMGRFFTKSGATIDTAFVLFHPSGNKVPLGGIGFGGDYYLAVATKIDSTFSDGDVYARFVQPLTTGISEENPLRSETYALSQNYPNPFNPSTTIQYALPFRSNVTLRVFNLLGQKVAELINQTQESGFYTVEWTANVSSGIYFYQMETASLDNTNKRFVDTKKMIFLK